MTAEPEERLDSIVLEVGLERSAKLVVSVDHVRAHFTIITPEHRTTISPDAARAIAAFLLGAEPLNTTAAQETHDDHE